MTGLCLPECADFVKEFYFSLLFAGAVTGLIFVIMGSSNK
jgi:hypothetical protein